LYFKLSLKNYYNLSQTETKVTGKDRKQWIMNYTKKVDWKLERETKLKLRRDLLAVAGALKLYSDKDKLSGYKLHLARNLNRPFSRGCMYGKLEMDDFMIYYNYIASQLQLEVKWLFFFSVSNLFKLHPFITNLMSYKLNL